MSRTYQSDTIYDETGENAIKVDIERSYVHVDRSNTKRKVGPWQVLIRNTSVLSGIEIMPANVSILCAAITRAAETAAAWNEEERPKSSPDVVAKSEKSAETEPKSDYVPHHLR